jgi:type II secretion system protein C
VTLANSPSPSQTEHSARAATNQTATLADIVRPQPVFAKGVQRGYRFYPNRDPQEFAALGLQHGDLVVAINGVPLDDPQGSMLAFNAVVSVYGVNVTVERSGRTQVITLGAMPIVPSDAVLPTLPTPPP